MTIFIRAAKELIIEALKASIEKAQKSDYGILGFMRNIKLSKKQIEYIEKLIEEITKFNDQKDDKESLDKLKQIILNTDKEIQTLRENHDYPRGDTNKLLVDLNSSLDRLNHLLNNLPDFPLMLTKKQVDTPEKNEQLEKKQKSSTDTQNEEGGLNFFNIPDDKEPFHILLVHTIIYLGEKIFSEGLPGIFVHTLSQMTEVSDVETRKLKEESLLRNVRACHKTLAALSSNKIDVRKQNVLSAIQLIGLENKKICQEKSFGPEFPVELTFFTKAVIKPTMGQPSEGRLAQCLKNAMEEIENETKKEDTPSLPEHSTNSKKSPSSINKKSKH